MITHNNEEFALLDCGVIQTSNEAFTIHKADSSEAEPVKHFMTLALSQRAKAANSLVDIDTIKEILASKLSIALIGTYNDDPVAFAYISKRVSLVPNNNVLYLEAFYVEDSMRVLDLGNILLGYIKCLAHTLDYARIEIECPTKPPSSSLMFVQLGAKFVKDHIMYVFEKEEDVTSNTF